MADCALRWCQTLRQRTHCTSRTCTASAQLRLECVHVEGVVNSLWGNMIAAGQGTARSCLHADSKRMVGMVWRPHSVVHCSSCRLDLRSASASSNTYCTWQRSAQLRSWAVGCSRARQGSGHVGTRTIKSGRAGRWRRGLCGRTIVAWLFTTERWPKSSVHGSGKVMLK